MNSQDEEGLADKQGDVVKSAKKMLDLVKTVENVERRAKLGSEVHDIVLKDHALIMVKPCPSLEDLSAAQTLDEIGAELREFIRQTGY